MHILTHSFKIYLIFKFQVECVQCVQLWRSASSHKESRSCGPHASTCRGNACFMSEQICAKNQEIEIFRAIQTYSRVSIRLRLYSSGRLAVKSIRGLSFKYLFFTIFKIQINRRYLETRMTRFGAILLCEDTFNQTTCICNRWLLF